MNEETTATLLVAEDDPATQRFLADELTADGYEVVVADGVADALRLVGTRFPDLAILDVGLGDGSGLDVVRQVRQADRAASAIDPDLPLLVLSGRATEVDRVRAFELGADDFVAKPYAYAELRGRVRALLRRAEGRGRSGRVRVGPLELDPDSRRVRLDGEPVELTQKEYALLRVLAGSPTRVHTKEELLRSVWGFRSRAATRTLDSHASARACGSTLRDSTSGPD